MKKPEKPYKVSKKAIREDILAEAKTLRIHSGFAEQIADRTLVRVEKYLLSHPVVTKIDIERIVYEELKKYNKDLAYIYHNRDKII